MVETVLTEKTLNSDYLGGTLPTVEASINSTSFVEVPLGGSWDLDIPDNVYYCFTPFVYNKHVTYYLTLEIREADGVTVLETFTMNDHNGTNRRHNTGIKFHDNSKWSNKTGLRLFAKSQHTSYVQKVYANSLVFAYAPHINISDLAQTKMMVNNLKMLQCGGIAEGGEGGQSKDSDSSFKTIPINAIKEGLIFSGNSGEMLFDWDGYSVGIAP